jgi:hypothetical protein
MQMAGRLFWEVRPDGSVRTEGLHLEGFARILWDALRSSGYPTPTTYEAMETVQLGVPRCRVQVSVPLHPDQPEWADLSTDVVSVQLLETLEVAALGVLKSFCAQHPDECPPYWWDCYRQWTPRTPRGGTVWGTWPNFWPACAHSMRCRRWFGTRVRCTVCRPFAVLLPPR